MRIIGAGLAGLLAANMLRHHNPLVMEKQASLPNNHSAVLRFRSDIVSHVTGIEFKKVKVIRDTLACLNPVADALSYAKKNTGKFRSDRSIPSGASIVERYIAPFNLIERLAGRVAIRYGVDLTSYPISPAPVISTIPMPSLMSLLNYDKIPEFEFVDGYNITAKVKNCDAYVSLYIPDPVFPISRISITGDELVAEIPNPYLTVMSDRNVNSDLDILLPAASFLGIETHDLYDIGGGSQTFAKIQPIDDGARKRFIAWATDTHNVYSLGRYATWRPGLLLDDLVQDIRLIERWINGGTYEMRRGR